MRSWSSAADFHVAGAGPEVDVDVLALDAAERHGMAPVHHGQTARTTPAANLRTVSPGAAPRYVGSAGTARAPRLRMRSPAALLVLVASLSGSLARAEEPAPAATAPLPVPPIVAAPLPVPPIVAAPPPYARPYYLPPPWWALPVPIKERHSKGMMITGIAFFGAGAVVTTAGLALLGIAESGPCGRTRSGAHRSAAPAVGVGPERAPVIQRPDGRGAGHGAASRLFLRQSFQRQRRARRPRGGRPRQRGGHPALPGGEQEGAGAPPPRRRRAAGAARGHGQRFVALVVLTGTIDDVATTSPRATRLRREERRQRRAGPFRIGEGGESDALPLLSSPRPPSSRRTATRMRLPAAPLTADGSRRCGPHPVGAVRVLIGATAAGITPSTTGIP